MCFSRPKPQTPTMAPERLTFRNLTSRPLTINIIEHFPAPGSKPAIDLKNIKDINVGKLASGFGKLVLGKKDAPTVPELAASAAAFAKRDVDIHLAPFETRESDVKVKEKDGSEQVRITFTARDPDARFRIDVNTGAGEIYSAKATGLSEVGERRIAVSYLPSKGHVAFYSHAELDSWQAKLQDRTSLSSLSMPGTHNSPCHYIALPSVRCQAVNITEQLNHGVRFFDLRAQPDGQDLILVHSVFPISISGKKYLRDVLNDFYRFLDAHPTEVLIVSLKREGTGNATDQDFSKILHEQFVKKDERRWFLQNRIPSLGEVRGKCILLRRFNTDASVPRDFGIDGSSWADNTPDAMTRDRNLRVQDFYEVKDNLNIDRKAEYVRALMYVSSRFQSSLSGEPTQTNGEKFPLFVNFLSASNFWSVDTWPERIAEKINPAVAEWLQVSQGKESGDGTVGVMVADFVGDGGRWTLVELCVALNAKLEVRERGS